MVTEEIIDSLYQECKDYRPDMLTLGTLDEFEEKLANLKLFYEQAIPKVGWEKYSMINLKYKNQIVCTKK